MSTNYILVIILDYVVNINDHTAFSKTSEHNPGRLNYSHHRKQNQAADTHTLTQLTDEEGAQRGFLVVILNVYVDDMHRLQGLLLS